MSVESLHPRADDELGRALATLPTLAPPHDAWPRMAAQLRVKQLAQAKRLRRQHWAIAAATAFFAVLAAWQAVRVTSSDTQAVPAISATAPLSNDRSSALIERSAELEAMLAWMTGGGRNAESLALELRLIDRLQWVDRLLAEPANSRATAEVLWQQRVDLLTERVALSQRESLFTAANGAAPVITL